MNWQAMLAATLAFFVGVWCGIGWQTPFIKMVKQAEEERDHYKKQYVDLHKKTTKLIAVLERVFAQAGYPLS